MDLQIQDGSLTKINLEYFAQFPEAFYPPINPTTYAYRCSLGLSRMLNYKVGIYGLARNIEKHINSLQLRLAKLCSYFKQSSITFFENDSTDNTLAILQSWTLPNFKVISETCNNPLRTGTGIERRREMAYYRNKYIPEIKDEDFVIIIDTDTYGWSYEGIANSFGQWNNNIGCIGSNGLIYHDNNELFYDIYAYREIGQRKHDWHQNTLKLVRGEELRQVNSAFGGLAIYSREAIHNCVYQDWDCDHVTVNKQVREKNLDVYINPSQIVLFSPHYYSIS